MTDIARAPRAARERAAVCLVLVVVMTFTGCRAVTWRAPGFAFPQRVAGPSFPEIVNHSLQTRGCLTDGWQLAASIPLVAAEQSYARGRQLENGGLAECVDAYYQAALSCWPIVEQGLRVGDDSDALNRAWELYHSSLAKLISTGQTYGRLDPRRSLYLSGPGGAVVGVRHVGSPWIPEDFTQLILVGDYSHKKLTNAYRASGLGVPVVVRSANKESHQFLRPHQVFAATAILRPTSPPPCETLGPATPDLVSLELMDPFRIASIQVGGIPLPIARDLSAPIAYRLMPRDRNPVRGFLQRGYSIAEAGLYMIEPYQRGKIPLVFVHGLLSDPLTWADLANELRARPEIVARYQLWAFEYGTGQPFLRSAAKLREELQTARFQLDPLHQDAALDQMVLIGHSLGGLVSKLQVTASGSLLWDAIANQPLQQIRAEGATKHDMARLFFFQPVPAVKRVIFIGTPHRGSAWARRCIGRLGASLVSEPPEERQQHLQIIADNPEVFAPELRRRTPTSIDLLEPDSRLLQAMETLPVSGAVQLHSIIGTGRRMIGSGPADGVVPVSSARHIGVSEKFVDTRHEDLHRDPDSVAEVVRILQSHAGSPPR